MSGGSCSAAATWDSAACAVDEREFRVAMRNLAGACTIIATGPPDDPAGLTATAVCSLSARPPRLLVCVNRSTQTHRMIDKTRRLSVNVLADQHMELASSFGGITPSPGGQGRFAQGNWSIGSTGVMVLADAAASFECSLWQTVAAGTHTIFLCDVESVRHGSPGSRPLLYFNGEFARLG